MAGQDRQVVVTLQIKSGANQLQALKDLKKTLDEVGNDAKRPQKPLGLAADDVKQVATDAANRAARTRQSAADARAAARPAAPAPRPQPAPRPIIAPRAAPSPAGGAAAAESGLAGAAAKFAAPLVVAAAVHKVIDAAADAAKLAGDRYLTDAQRGRQFFKNNVPGGETIQGWVDSFSGRDARMQQVEMNRQRTGVDRSIGAEKIGFDLKTNPMLAELQEREKQALAYSGTFLEAPERPQEKAPAPPAAPVPVKSEPTYDRSTTQGEAEFRAAFPDAFPKDTARERLEKAVYLPREKPEAAAAPAAAAPEVKGRGTFDRTTAQGELEFRQASRLLPVRRDLAKAEQNLAATTAGRRASEMELNKLAASEYGLKVQQAKLNEKIRQDNTSGPERQQALADLEDINKRLETVTRGKQAAADSVFGAKTKEAEAARGVRQQQAAMAEAKAANLEEQAATSAGGARRLGGMNVMDRGFAVQAVKMVQQFGPDNVPPEVLAAAQQAAPETIGKITETSGAKTREFKELQKLAPADFGPEGSSPEELRKKAQTARDEAEGARVTGDQEFAKAGAAAGKDMAGIITSAFKTLVDVLKQELETAIRIQKGQM